MLLRRLWTAAPLAIFVAVLAHIAGFGRAHMPGTRHAADLFVALAFALAVLAGGIVVRAVVARVRPARVSDETPRRRHGLREIFANAAVLAALGAMAFAAIEAIEGHFALGGSLRALAALVPIAALVAALAPRVARSLDRIGTHIGALLVFRRLGIARALTIDRLARRAARARARRAPASGLSPPHLA